MKSRMKKLTGIITALTLIIAMVPSAAFAAEEVDINETNFPDEIFRSFVSNAIDGNGDGILSEDEINDKTVFMFSTDGTIDLTGIEYFTALEELYCYNCKLGKLDLSKNINLKTLECSGNGLTELDVTGLTKLVELTCEDNELTELDISKNRNLEKLECGKNRLTEIDLSNNPLLTRIRINGNNIKKIDVSHQPDLVALQCVECGLEELDLTNNPNISALCASLNHFTNFDMLNYKWKILLLDDNEYIVPSDSIDLTTLPGDFKVENASDWTGGTVKGNIFTFDEGSDKATYTYDCGISGDGYPFSQEFTLRRCADHPLIGGGTVEAEKTDKPGKPGQQETGVKTAEAPRTGDENNVSLWVMLLTGSLLCAGAAVRKKERR